MYWTQELASYLDLAPWPATKYELIEFCKRTGAPDEVIINLGELDGGEDEIVYQSIEDIWPDSPSANEQFFDDDNF